MQALIDNYTTFEQVEPNVAFKFYVMDFDTSTNSVVAQSPRHDGINSRIHRLLKEFEKLENNWDGCDALAPDKSALQWARHLACLLERRGQPIYHAAPGPNAEIMLDIRNEQNDKAFEIVFYPDRSVIVFFPSFGQPWQANLNTDDLPDYLTWLNE